VFSSYSCQKTDDQGNITLVTGIKAINERDENTFILVEKSLFGKTIRHKSPKIYYSLFLKFSKLPNKKLC
jgi:hypothetical protein